MLYALAWFFCDFFRDQGGVYVAGKVVFGLRLIQWYLLGTSFLLGLLLANNERIYRNRSRTNGPVRQTGILRVTSFTLIL
jgi:hypothetical protein